MVKPVNLGQARKKRDRAQKRATADSNALKFGRTKSEKLLEDARSQALQRHLDGHKRDD